MSYIKDQFEISRDQHFPNAMHVFQRDAFDQGLKEGFKIALLTYGVWKDGTQVIGCHDTRVREIIAKELGEE